MPVSKGGKEVYIIVTGYDGNQGLQRAAEDMDAILVKLGRPSKANHLGRTCLAKR